MTITQLIIVLVALLAVIFLWGLARWQALLQTLPAGLEFHEADLDHVPRLADPVWQQFTTELEALGFWQRQDYSMTAELGQTPPVIGRVFHHPDQACFAQLEQMLADGYPAGPLTCTLTSLLSDHWTVQTLTPSPSLLIQLATLSNLAYNSHVQARPADLLRSHLEFRSHLLQTHPLELLPESNLEALWIKLKELAWRRKQVLKRQNSLGSFVQGIGLALRSRSQWIPRPPSR